MGIIVLHHRLFCGLNDLLFAKDLETAPGTYINNKKLNNRHLETLSLACMWMDGWVTEEQVDRVEASCGPFFLMFHQ